MKMSELRARLEDSVPAPVVEATIRSLDASRIADAPQSAIPFIQSQAAHIHRTLYEKKYEGIIYQELCPVDATAPEYAPSVIRYYDDMIGNAEWVAGGASDVANADSQREQDSQSIYMAGIGYEYTLEEIGVAQQVGYPLNTRKASAARRGYEQFMQNLAFLGDSRVGFTGMLNNGSVNAADVALNAGTTSRLWANKTADEILADLNEPINATYSGSKMIERANTLLLPPSAMTEAATKRIPDTNTTVLEFFKRTNTYTAETGQSLTVRGVNQLETAGSGGTRRLMAYRRDDEVLSLDLPMPHKFLPVFPRGGIKFAVPGVFRTGGVDFRYPGAARYRDGF